ncbi:MAG: N-succinylarginine dihydrolase [Actinomycetota bacterium]
MTAEVNFDGLVGPTHNYAGLSMGNRASMKNAGGVSSPRRAALQGLAKMRELAALGLTQAVLPPPLRPDPTALAALGFGGPNPMAQVAADRPDLVSTVLSASAMWAANAATVSPSVDTADGRVHLTPANLSATTHRSFEHDQTMRILGAIFADAERFVVHPALPQTSAFADEGAANHGRFTDDHGAAGVQLFVYGRDHDEPSAVDGFPRRQTRLAGELIARGHGVDPARTVFARQSPVAIDAGAFHNDVVSVVNQRVLFTHEHAFDDRAALVAAVSAAGIEPSVVVVPDARVPLADAISSYLFNSQLVTLPDGTMTLIAPTEVAETPSTAAYLDAAVADPDNPINGYRSFDLRQSMRNGGGPACLRLRVVLTDAEQAALRGRVLVDERLLEDLGGWVEDHYRDALSPDDLTDPALVAETAGAMDALARLLGLPDLYR